MSTSRHPARGDAAAVLGGSGRPVTVIPLDLSNLASVRAAASTLLDGRDRIDLLICNAAHQARARARTIDGFEMTFGVNHLGHALLVELLRGRLVASTPSRVIMVASGAHRRAVGGLDFDDLMMARGRFRPKLAYNRSKLANILYTRELARRLAGTGVDVNAVHPGAVDTPMMRANFRGPLMTAFYRTVVAPVLLSPGQAAAGVLRVALDPELQGTSGEYFELGRRARSSPAGTDARSAGRLWSETDRLLGLSSGSGPTVEGDDRHHR